LPQLRRFGVRRQSEAATAHYTKRADFKTL
jgi:hypothetical protein